MSSRNIDFHVLPARVAAKLLDGRPVDPRVKYSTGFNRGKTYTAHPPVKLTAENFIEATASTTGETK